MDSFYIILHTKDIIVKLIQIVIKCKNNGE